jgi:hypothetical protein
MDTSGDERFDSVGEETSTAVTHAASVLEEELAAGLATARRLEERLTAERQVDPEALDDLVTRVRKDGHALIDTVAAQLPMAEGDARTEVVRRYTTDAHDVLDTVLNLARLVPDITNGLLNRLTTEAPSAREAGGTGSADSTRQAPL